ncbi:MAG: sulfatase-like hydrolase/transferase [Pseudomonadota bacterium]
MASTSSRDRDNLNTQQQPARITTILVWAALLTAFMAVTTNGFSDRATLLMAQERVGTLVLYLGVWAVCWVCFLVAAMQPNRIVRWVWACILSLSVAASQAYFLVSGSDLGPFDVLSLKAASHELGRAMAQFVSAAIWFGCVFAGSLAVIVLAPTPGFRLWRSHGTKLAWMPALPVALIGAILIMKEGGGSHALPQHFTPLAVTAVTLTKTAMQPKVTRAQQVVKPTGKPAVRNIVMLVDESIRGDYVDLTPGNPFTPLLAKRTSDIVNFGASASGGNCSHYSNALLRLGGSRRDIVNSVNHNPTIWQFAKQAGYRTVFIDAQASVNKNRSRLQNFMTPGEVKDIDRFVTFDDVATPDLDHELMNVVKQELAQAGPVFIYANKNGAHFPYHHGYPAHDAPFKVDGPQDWSASKAAIIKSYLNNIRWNVDRLLADFLDTTNLTNTVVLYTSDHGQAFNPGGITHCSVDNPDPREGLVPMLAMTSHPAVLSRLKSSAEKSWAKTSHFQIAPTILGLMGYSSQTIAKSHGPSLFEAPAPEISSGFSSGDIFGLFRQDVRWNDLDLTKSYLEPEARQLPGARHSAQVAD